MFEIATHYGLKTHHHNEGFQYEDEKTDSYSGNTPTTIRNKFAGYVIGEGQIPWQLDSIHK